MDIDRKNEVGNPLTIIAIFCGLCEVSGTVVMKIIKEGLQVYLLIFICLYPVLLTILFFIVLYTRPQNFYSQKQYEAPHKELKKKLDSLDELVKIYDSEGINISD